MDGVNIEVACQKQSVVECVVIIFYFMSMARKTSPTRERACHLSCGLRGLPEGAQAQVPGSATFTCSKKLQHFSCKVYSN
jgi:hypothetical protein